MVSLYRKNPILTEIKVHVSRHMELSLHIAPHFGLLRVSSTFLRTVFFFSTLHKHGTKSNIPMRSVAKGSSLAFCNYPARLKKFEAEIVRAGYMEM